MNSMISLFTSYYDAKDKVRQLEIDECLERNLSNPAISQIILLIDDESVPPVESEKVSIVHLKSRPTYATWLRLVRSRELTGAAILANSDIYFDHSIQRASEALTSARTLIALTRWDVRNEELVAHGNPQWSQDCWIVDAREEIPDSLIERLEFPMGVPRCDNKIAYVFSTAGWILKNPVKEITSYHLHGSEVRNYDKVADTRILGTVAYVSPSDLETPARVQYDTWTLRTEDVTSTTLNKTLVKHQVATSAAPAEIVTMPSANDESTEIVPPPTPTVLYRQPRTVRRGKRLVAGLQTYGPRDRAGILESGTCVLSIGGDLAVYEGSDKYLIVNGSRPDKWSVISRDAANERSPEVLASLVGPVATNDVAIRNEAASSEDLLFWQYPCITEKQAFQNHQFRSGPHVHPESKVIHTYVGLPWATFIDRKEIPAKLLDRVRQRIASYRDCAEHFGYTLQVHTVCQHIRWRNVLNGFEQIGITDLWLSHCTDSEQRDWPQDGIRLHPWSLYAVNAADHSRSEGIIRGKLMQERKLLASFIGAHMKHYRSDIRVRLVNGLESLGREDIVVSLGDLWHFNKIVFDGQVFNKPLMDADNREERVRTVRYNQILSDSKFSLCPEGAGPNTLRFWESIAVGSIPVLFERDLLYPEGLDSRVRELCLFWDGPIDENFCAWLESFHNDELQYRSNELLELYTEAERITCF